MWRTKINYCPFNHINFNLGLTSISIYTRKPGAQFLPESQLPINVLWLWLALNTLVQKDIKFLVGDQDAFGEMMYNGNLTLFEVSVWLARELLLLLLLLLGNIKIPKLKGVPTTFPFEYTSNMFEFTNTHTHTKIVGERQITTSSCIVK